MEDDDGNIKIKKKNVGCIHKEYLMNFIFIISSGVGLLNLISLISLKYIYISNFIFYDSLININILNYCIKNSKKILIGKKFNQYSILKKTIYILIFLSYIKYFFISKLKSGDINFFSRINNEINYYRYKNFNYFILSGITTFLAIFCKLKWFITIRFNITNILFITYFNGNYLKNNDVFFNQIIIYYMLNNNLNYILNNFLNNLFFYFCIIENCNFLNEYIYLINIYDFKFYLNSNFLNYNYIKILIIGKLENYININNLLINIL